MSQIVLYACGEAILYVHSVDGEQIFTMVNATPNVRIILIHIEYKEFA